MIIRLHSAVAPVATAPRYQPPVDRRTLRERITSEERARIAAIAATIPDKKPPPLSLVPARNFGAELREHVLAEARICKRDWTAKRRKGRSAAASAGIAHVLRAKDAEFYSYPMIARIIGRKDHTTVIHAVKRWYRWADKYPDIARICYQALRGDNGAL